MSWDYGGWGTYVSAAARRRKVERAIEKLRKRGVVVSPVKIEGRRIATTFWGKAWCDNLESYRDYENRLERGRTYVRNGSVVDLQIAAREVTARVSGSRLYKVKVGIANVATARWKATLRRLFGGNRLPCRTAAGALFQSGDGAHLPSGYRLVSAPIGNSFRVQLPGPCVDVQACRGRALRRWRAARPQP